MAADSVGILDIPEEILLNIFSSLSLHDLASCIRTCKQFLQVSDSSLLWRNHCVQHFKYWHSIHNLPRKLQEPAPNTGWKRILSERIEQDEYIRRNFESTLSSQYRRIPKIKAIVNQGDDAKDLLEAQLDCPEDAEDVLARRFWSNEIIGSVHRAEALELWKEIREKPNYPLEKALATFDLWIAEKPPETPDQVMQHMDTVTAAFKLQTPQLDKYTDREKALAIVRFLVSHNLTGMPPETQLRELQNALIGVVLCSEGHPSLPVVSAAIYCAVARRVGLTAGVCNLPYKVYVTVRASSATDLDGESRDDTDLDEWDPRLSMFLDPFQDAEEVGIHALRAMLASCPPGLRSKGIGELRPAATGALMGRMANNLINTLRELGHGYTKVLERPSMDFIPADMDPPQPTILNAYRAAYCGWWGLILFIGVRHGIAILHNALQRFSDDFTSHFREFDVNHVERYLMPEFTEGPEQDFLQKLLSAISNDDSRRPPQRLRGGEDGKKVSYRVGDVFTHKNYGYHAAITGWDPSCAAEERWIDTMQVDLLSQGRQQAFYHVIADDQSSRYVADQNIAPLSAETVMDGFKPDEALMRIAGRFFKRYDERAKRFVSNLEEQYPDD